MKKIISLALCALLLVSCFAFASCGEQSDYVATDASDLLAEDFAIAVKKGNTALLEEVNEVIDEWVEDGTMDEYITYYQNYSDYANGTGEEPDAGDLKISWNFGNATEAITVYTESGFAPFEYLAGGEIIGVDIAIMSQVAENMGKKLIIKDVAFDTITTCVDQSTGDAVGAAGLSITPDRLDEVDFSSVYYKSTLVLVSHKDVAYSSVASVSGLKVGVQEGTSGDTVVTDAAKGGYTVGEGEDASVIEIEESTTIKRYKQYALAFADLQAGRIDAILMDKLPALTMLAMAE